MIRIEKKKNGGGVSVHDTATVPRALILLLGFLRPSDRTDLCRSGSGINGTVV